MINPFFFTEEKEQLKDPESRLKTVTNETRDILDTFKREYKPAETKVEEKVRADSVNAAHYSQGIHKKTMIWKYFWCKLYVGDLGRLSAI